jgi:hypothetical protein
LHAQFRRRCRSQRLARIAATATPASDSRTTVSVSGSSDALPAGVADRRVDVVVRSLPGWDEPFAGGLELVVEDRLREVGEVGDDTSDATTRRPAAAREGGLLA